MGLLYLYLYHYHNIIKNPCFLNVRFRFMEVGGTEQKERRVRILTEVGVTSIMKRKEYQSDETKLAEKSRVRVKIIK